MAIGLGRAPDPSWVPLIVLLALWSLSVAASEAAQWHHGTAGAYHGPSSSAGGWGG